MKRATLISAGIVGLFVGLALARADAAPPVLEVAQECVEAARPGGELTQLQLLNGQPTPFLMPDGGVAGFFGTSAGCLAVNSTYSATAGINQGDTLLIMPLDGGVGICTDLQDGGTCLAYTSHANSAAALDVGVYVPALTAYYVVTSNNATKLCSSGGGEVDVKKMK